MNSTTYQLAAGALQVSGIVTAIAVGLDTYGAREIFAYSGWMLALEVAAGYAAMFVIVLALSGALQLLSSRLPTPPVVTAREGK